MEIRKERGQMQETFSLEELQKMIKENKYKEKDQIYCNEYPNLIFIYEKGEFVGYYADGHDLFGDGSLKELIKNKDSRFSNEPFISYPDEMS